MKGFKVKFNARGNEFIGYIVSEPYPLISPQQLNIPRNGGTYVGSTSVTCVVIAISGNMFVDVPLGDCIIAEEK